MIDYFFMNLPLKYSTNVPPYKTHNLMFFISFDLATFLFIFFITELMKIHFMIYI